MNNPTPPPSPEPPSGGWPKAFVYIMAFIGVCLVLGKCAEFASIVSRHKRVENSASFVKTEKTPKDYFYELGDTERFNGTPYVVTRLYRKQNRFKGYQSIVMNYLLLNTTTGKSEWLWQGKFPYILSESRLLDQQVTNYRSSTPINSLLVTLVDADSNKNGTYEEEDLKALVTLAPGSSTPVIKLLDGVEKLESIVPLEKDKMLIIYVRDKKTFSAIYTGKTRALSLQTEIPAIALP